jgi:hypothetical protein
MTRNITKVINEKEKMMLETAAHFISICYAPWPLKSGCQSPLKCPVCHQVCLPDQGPLPKAQAGSACRHAAHFWNLPDDLVLLALADDDIELELKSKSS